MGKKNRKLPTYMTDLWRKFNVKDCHEPKWVQVGDHQVFLCGYCDLKVGIDRTIAGLDVFIALDDIWENEVRRVNVSNPLMARLAKALKHGIPNIFIHHITDHSISPVLAKEVVKIVSEGYKIGFGCFGGHGRAGWLLGYLLREIEGLEDQALINAIRNRWCSEALEGKVQFDSLGLLDYWITSASTYTSGSAHIRYDHENAVGLTVKEYLDTGTWKQINNLEVKRQSNLNSPISQLRVKDKFHRNGEDFIEIECEVCHGKDKKCLACDGEGTVIEVVNGGGWVK